MTNQPRGFGGADAVDSVKGPASSRDSIVNLTSLSEKVVDE